MFLRNFYPLRPTLYDLHSDYRALYSHRLSLGNAFQINWYISIIASEIKRSESEKHGPEMKWLSDHCSHCNETLSSAHAQKAG
jgi:hypothetical protein